MTSPHPHAALSSATPPAIGLWGPPRQACAVSDLQDQLARAGLPAIALSPENLVGRARQGRLPVALLLWPPSKPVWPPELSSWTYIVTVHENPDAEAARLAAGWGAVSAVALHGDAGLWLPHVSVLFHRFLDEAAEAERQAELQREEAQRVRVSTAAGLLCERHGIGLPAAHRQLEHLARQHGRPVDAVAAELVRPHG